MLKRGLKVINPLVYLFLVGLPFQSDEASRNENGFKFHSNSFVHIYGFRFH